MTITMSTRRLIAATGFAAALLITPTVAAITNGAPASHTLAGCAQTQSGASSSIVCSPNVSRGVAGAPSEQEITAKNAQRTRGGLGI
ncbi:MAG: hypothetical protein JO280_07040 [Mycobacteriaceae bacterium]|nr:hypothetical protein [Mycobacteriaceae bacterium]